VSTPTDDDATTTSAPDTTASGDTGATGLLRTLAALAMLGAAVIHFAFAPDHLAEQTSHGVFFLVAGWAQLLGAAALAFRWMPSRAWLLGSAAFNLGVAGLWLLSRTAGLPGDEAEPVGFPDTLATALEVVAALAALAIALGWVSRAATAAPAAPRRTSPILTAVPAVALIGLVTASVVPSLGGGHAHADGDEHGHDDAMGDMEGMDHGHDDGAAAGGDDFAEQRLAALTGYLPQAEIDRLSEINRQYVAQQIRDRSRKLAGLPEAEREEIIAAFAEWTVDNALLAENGEQTGDSDAPTMHSHGVSVWQDLTDPADTMKLQQELQTAGALIPRFATAADSVAAGYFQVTPYVPGIGAHYINIRLVMDDGFDPAEPEMLLYNGNDPTSELVGFSYAVVGEDPPAGFTGPNDSWHVHPSLCLVGGLVVGPDSTPQDMCDSIGGQKGRTFGQSLWMAHLWQVPGWESPWGLFSGENPVVNLATSDVGHTTG
jgi:hypothetical protein